MNTKGELRPANIILGVLIFAMISLAVSQLIIYTSVENSITLEQNMSESFDNIYADALSYKGNISANSEDVSARDPDADSSIWSKSWKTLNTVLDAPSTAVNMIKTVQNMIGFKQLPAAFWNTIIAIVVILIIFAVVAVFRGYPLQK